MRNLTLIGLLVALASRASAACSSALKIDDFSKWSSNTNSLNSWTSDDASMSSISASGGVLSFKPKADSYFYESFSCQAASSNGYNSVQFSVKGPAGGQLTLELQTQSSCTATTYTSYYTTVSGLTGNTQTITVPLTSFSGANGNAIVSLVWWGFSSTTSTWQLSNVQFGCNGALSSSSTSSSSSSTRSTSTPTSVSSTLSSVVSKVSSVSSASSSASFASSSVSSTSSSVSSASSSISSTSSSVSSTSSIRSLSSTLSTIVSTPSPSGTPGACAPLLVDDWTSQSRLTFLFYNAMWLPSSDDASMTSLVVANNRVTINPKNTASYFYSQLGCTNAQNKYGGLSLRIKAPAGSSFAVELDSSATCDPGAAVPITKTSKDLGWTFDGTEKLYTIPFSKFDGLDTSKLVTILFSQFSKSVSFGPLAFYCGNTGSEYVVTTTAVSAGPSSTVAAPSGTAATLVIDKFANKDANALGFWHGVDDGMTATYSGGKLTLKSTDADYSFYSQVSASCTDMTKYQGSYLHIAYSGSTSFTVALQQHNSKCDANIAPYPETWDSLEASRYASNGHIYMPMSHFNVQLIRTIGLAFKGFYSSNPVTLSVIEIVPSIPAGFTIPNKLESGDLVFACKRPNSFAFAIDDGSPEYAQEVLKIVREENIKVTFFTVGAPLLDPSTNLTNVYREMLAAGHQVALHSMTHPKMEGLPDYASIDWEYQQDIKTVDQQLGGLHTNYFRPPFGTEGARMRQRLAVALGAKPTVTVWSVDVEDWLWAQTSTPEQQLTAFQRDVDKGGNLVVLHYLYPSTVGYLRQFIQIAKKTNKQLMRVDQCMQDPNAPPL